MKCPGCTHDPVDATGAYYPCINCEYRKLWEVDVRADLLPKTWEGRLARLEEECGELIKAIGKMHRFGRVATDPKTKIKYDNVCDIMDEAKDVKDAAERFLSGT